MDPTPTELATFGSVGVVAAWAGFSGMAADTTVGGSLFATLGLTTALVPRIIGVISEAGYTAAIQTWRVPRRNLGILTGHQWLHQIVHLLWLNLVRQLFGRACRIAAGNGETLEDLRAKAKAAGTASAAPAPASTSTSKKLKMNAIALHYTQLRLRLQLQLQLQPQLQYYNFDNFNNINTTTTTTTTATTTTTTATTTATTTTTTTALHHTTSRSCE